jgi:hypothetical protein
MPRFVVLTHNHPFLHWDLMLEQGESLRTWRLVRPPDTATLVETEALGDHRLAYLDYEGPVSGGRGTVERWDVGTYETVESTDNRVVIRLAGRKLDGLATLERLGNEAAWIFRRIPAPYAGS